MDGIRTVAWVARKGSNGGTDGRNVLFRVRTVTGVVVFVLEGSALLVGQGHVGGGFGSASNVHFRDVRTVIDGFTVVTFPGRDDNGVIVGRRVVTRTRNGSCRWIGCKKFERLLRWRLGWRRPVTSRSACFGVGVFGVPFDHLSAASFLLVHGSVATPVTDWIEREENVWIGEFLG